MARLYDGRQPVALGNVHPDDPMFDPAAPAWFHGWVHVDEAGIIAGLGPGDPPLGLPGWVPVAVTLAGAIAPIALRGPWRR